MAKGPKLTPVEWEIMETIWELGGSPSVRDVLERAYPQGEKAYTTIQTIMNTLLKKGLLERKKIGLVNFYTPTRTRQNMVEAEINRVINKMFRGSVPALANHLINTDGLSLKEIQHIQQILNEKEKALKDKV
jgi:predicted transcriptional regulator